MSTTRVIDLAPLERLLHFAGASGVSALLEVFFDDLQTTQMGFDAAWNGPDFAALRTNSHVLIALAGTIGDTELQNLAQRVNVAAHVHNRMDLIDMKPKIMTGLSDLIGALVRLQTNKAG